MDEQQFAYKFKNLNIFSSLNKSFTHPPGSFWLPLQKLYKTTKAILSAYGKLNHNIFKVLLQNIFNILEV